MKRFILICSLCIFLVSVISFRATEQPVITGRVNPAKSAKLVRAMSTTDTVTTVIVNGVFSFNVKPGNYNIYIEANESYKDVSLETIDIKEGETVNIGKIVLER